MAHACRTGLALVLLTAFGVPAAHADVVTRDPDARDVRALGNAVTWLRAAPFDDGESRVTLRYRVDGRAGRARSLPARYASSFPEAFGDLGRARSGHAVQVVGDSLGYLWFAGGDSSQGRFWAYDLTTERAQEIALPKLPAGCIVERVAVWYRLTAAAADCSGDGVVFVANGPRVQQLFRIPRLNRFATITVELDVTDEGVAVGLAIKRCSRGSSDDTCSIELGPGGLSYDSWLLRPGCEPRLLARSTSELRPLDPPRFAGKQVYWLSGLLSDRGRSATLRSRQLRGRCGVERTRTVARLGRWERLVSAALTGDSLFVARDRGGVRRRSLPR